MAEKLMPKRTFESINGGKPYIVDEEASKRYAVGGREIFGVYENSECEDLQQLMDETREYLKARTHPQVTYEADVVDLASMGCEWEGVGVGDDVDIVDTCFSPTLRCRGRVTKIVRDVLADTATVTLGNVTDTLTDAFARQIDREKNLQDKLNAMDGRGPDNDDYLDQLIDSLNERFDENGANYYHMDFQTGSTWSSVPLEEDGQPTQDGGWAINISSLGFRIASKRKEDGSWDWRTFGTGEGFTADNINAGTLNANLIRAGVIKSLNGNKSYWDLDTGQFYTQNARADNMQAYDMDAYRLNAHDLKVYGGIVVNPDLKQRMDIGITRPDAGPGIIQVRMGTVSYGYLQLAYKGPNNPHRGIRIAAFNGLYMSGGLRVSSGDEDGPWHEGVSFTDGEHATLIAEIHKTDHGIKWATWWAHFLKGLLVNWSGDHGGHLNW